MKSQLREVVTVGIKPVVLMVLETIFLALLVLALMLVWLTRNARPACARRLLQVPDVFLTPTYETKDTIEGPPVRAKACHVRSEPPLPWSAAPDARAMRRRLRPEALPIPAGEPAR